MPAEEAGSVVGGLMAARPARPCSQPGCPELVRIGRRCADHRLGQERERDRRRPSMADRGYGPGWQARSRALVKAQPWCSNCLAEPTRENPLTVDHVISLKDGGETIDENLQVLCRRCNSAKGGR